MPFIPYLYFRQNVFKRFLGRLWMGSGRVFDTSGSDLFRRGMFQRDGIAACSQRFPYRTLPDRLKDESQKKSEG
jgi:hypothetical protein